MINNALPTLLFLAVTSAAHAATATATFESYPEGPIGPSFTEPSGFLFTNAFYNFGSTDFIVDHGEPAMPIPPILPGNYLTGGGYSPGPGAGLGAGFGFTATFPALSNRIDMDLLHSSFESGTLTLTGLNSANEFVTQKSITITSPGPGGAIVTHIFMDSATPMAKVMVAPGGMTLGFDNLAIPEPTSSAIFTALAAGWLLKRRRR